MRCKLPTSIRWICYTTKEMWKMMSRKCASMWHQSTSTSLQSGQEKTKGAVVDALSSDPDKVRRLSLSDQELTRVAARHGRNIVSFTHKNLLRIYPKGTRFNSSNYNPFLGWVHGAQMVAFNMQGYGRALWLMHGFCKANGGCGYVKKPDFLMQTCPDGNVFDPKADLPMKTTLKVKVYMGDGWQSDFKQQTGGYSRNSIGLGDEKDEGRGGQLGPGVGGGVRLPADRPGDRPVPRGGA